MTRHTLFNENARIEAVDLFLEVGAVQFDSDTEIDVYVGPSPAYGDGIPGATQNRPVGKATDWRREEDYSITAEIDYDFHMDLYHCSPLSKNVEVVDSGIVNLTLVDICLFPLPANPTP